VLLLLLLPAAAAGEPFCDRDVPAASPKLRSHRIGAACGVVVFAAILAPKDR